MAEASLKTPVMPAWMTRIARFQPMFVPMAVIGLIMVIVVPVPAIVLDLLITFNLAMAAMILLTTIFVERPLDFSVFPSLLLATTLYRLVLNVASTRLILSADAGSAEEATAIAGHVIEAFAQFVAGNSLVVGIIIFAILVIVQFVVITKGSTRISEVAARFTLDAMPGKQMAIDADLNAGMINEAEARKRRDAIAQEADFYGAMDGAAKFVRGDAIAAIIITFVNVIGGFAVGAFQRGWGIAESLEVFTKLTIGDGLVSQLPALVISIAAGLIVTRTSSRADLGTEISKQLMGQWRPLAITAGFLGMMAFTGLPAVPMLALASVFGVMAYYVRGGDRIKKVQSDQDAAAKAKPAPPAVEQMLAVDAMELEVGYGLVKLVDTTQGGSLLERITMIRRQLAGELGLVMPPIRIRDNMQLGPNDYHLKIRGNAVAGGVIYPGQFLAMDSGLVSPDHAPLEGTRTREPAFGLEAVWVEAGQKQRAESLNYTVVDPTSVLATHIIEVVKTNAYELLSREETNNLIAELKKRAPKLAEEVLGGERPLVKPGELQKVLQNLLRERVPIRDMETIVETLGDWAARTKDLEVLTEYVRNGLRRTICNQYVQQPPPDAVMDSPVVSGASVPMAPKLYCVSLDPALEDQILGFIDRSAEGTSFTMPPAMGNRIVSAVVSELQRLAAAGHHPVVLASPQVRGQVRRLLEPHMPNVAVLGYNEISKGVEVESMGLVSLNIEGVVGQGQGRGQPAVSATE